MMLLALSDAVLSVLSVVGMLIFLAVFSGIVAWVLTRPKRQVNRWSKLPLSDDPPTN